MVVTTANEQTLKRLRALCLALPETTETASWNHPNFKAGKKTFVAFERVKGRASIAFRLDPTDVEQLLRQEQFFATPYGRGLWASLWADGRIDWRAVEDLVERSDRVVALKRMLAALEGTARRR
jgi:predicted DNA-binding protein (MmcQ/YjbR family)